MEARGLRAPLDGTPLGPGSSRSDALAQREPGFWERGALTEARSRCGAWRAPEDRETEPEGGEAAAGPRLEPLGVSPRLRSEVDRLEIVEG